MRNYKWYSPAVPMALSAIVLSGCLSSGGGSSSRDDDETAPPEMTREHDDRTFSVVEKTFAALPGADIYFGTYDGLQGEAAYAFEAPTDWDGGGLVMWARGYGGEGENLPTVEPPLPWRATVLAHGYAWASSSYSANFYDARAGIEDTNKLALNVLDYVEYDHGVTFDEPSTYLISGASLGGHVAAAAVDKENMERTEFKVPYAGAAPFCQSEQNQFQWLGDYPRVMMELAGYGEEDFSRFQELVGEYQDFDGVPILTKPGPIVDALFNTNALGMPDWTSPKNEAAQQLIGIAQNLTGGTRPLFMHGFAGPLQSIVLGTGGSAGDINGILALNGYGNQDQEYRWTTDAEPTAEEIEFNERIDRVSADPDANLPREDGVRWIPLVNGEFDVPVLTMHTLGDFYVPFRHQQLYRERAEEHGNEDLLVQRAIRAPGHCDFSATEMSEAVNDWLTWTKGGPKPAGDEVMDPDVVADPAYGCEFTRGFIPAEGDNTSRDGLPGCPL